MSLFSTTKPSRTVNLDILALSSKIQEVALKEYLEFYSIFISVPVLSIQPVWW